MSAGTAPAARSWSRFWFAEVDARPYGLLRIAVALAGLHLWAGTLPLVRHFYSDAGEFPIAAARAWSREYAARFLMPDALGAYPAAAALLALWGLALVALLLGWRTRAAAWANWLLALWFFYRNATFTNGGDEVFRLVSFYLALGYAVVPPAGRALSLDRRAAARSGITGATDAAPTMPAWPLRFVQIQLCIVYVVSGFWKVVGPAWWDGSALQYAMDNDAFSRFGWPDWARARPVYAVLTISMAWWELLFPALVAWRRTRVPALLYGVALHLWILVFMNIGVFPFVMLAGYPAFLRGAEAARALGWVRARLAAGPGAARAAPQPSPHATRGCAGAPQASSATSASTAAAGSA